MDEMEEKLYHIAINELANRTYSKVLYAKACTVADGNERKAAGSYLYMRINELRQEYARAKSQLQKSAERHQKAICPFCGNRDHEQVQRLLATSNLRCNSCHTFYFVCN